MPIVRDETPDFREAFSLFDDRGDDKISKHLFGEVIRALGLNPTQGQIQSTIANFKTERISFEEFLPLYDSLAKRKENSINEDELIEGEFRVHQFLFDHFSCLIRFESIR